MKSKNILRLPRTRDLQSNKLKDIQDHLKIVYEELDKHLRLLWQDAQFGGDVIEVGTAQGQIMFWDVTLGKWVHTEITEVFWDDTNKRLRIGDATNYVRIDSDGDIVFVGTAGLSFGSCYGNHISWSQANAVQNTWYNISDSDMVDGNLNNVAHDGNGKLTVTNAGMYLVAYGVCFEDNAANDHVEVGIEVSGSGSAGASGQGHLENKFANEEEHLSSSMILDLAANATIETAIRTTDAGTPTISVQAVNISALQVGGT